MKRIFDKSWTTFEKIFFSLIFCYLIAFIVACNLNLDILVYAGFGTYVILGLLAFFRPRIFFEVLKKENEDYLVRNQKKIPLIKAAIRYGGLILALMGAFLNYVFIVYY
ncbi:MAG TPA: hypothetical protein GXX46_09510 [Peptococcaceae bacterium]|nr:hypothetical protein [Peptococcaceae bacterium]